MILSELKIDKSLRNTGKPILHQKCNVKCDICNKEYNINYLYVKKGRDLYNKDMCRSCKRKMQFKTGILQVGEHWKTYSVTHQKGKTFDELYGSNKTNIIKNKMSKQSSGKNNVNYGGKHGFQKGHNSVLKGKTYEELHGKEKAIKMKAKLSIASSGKNNNMYGKPSPKGSGNGWSGWYKEWYFRSLTELSYMINVIEKNNYQWENAENKKYRIPYNKNGIDRNYTGDFIINDKEYIEIKPKNLRNSIDVLLKEEAAVKWCEKHNLIYKIVCDNEFDKLSKKEIKLLHDDGSIKFIDRYEKKFKEKYE